MDLTGTGQGQDMAEAGTRIVADRYLLREPVGRGGMGVVWRADDRVLGRPVAVKEVHLQPGLADEERDALKQRVVREARAAAMLNHAGAVTVYDVAEDDDQTYIVMELVEAPTLADVVQDDGPLPPAEVARIGLAVLDVLAAAHASGIVHRDLKPGNVLVAGDSVKLTDFGIAQIKDDPRITSTGIVLGSPAYISPEQARGEATTPQTDLWGLGATLYYGVCGQPPFDRGEAIATLTAVAHDELRMDPCAGPLAPVLRAMLAKDPVQRPSAADLRAMLTAVANGATVEIDETQPGIPAVQAAPPDATQPIAVPPRDDARVLPVDRRPWWRVPLVALLFLAAAAAAVFVGLRSTDLGGARPRASAAPPRDVPGVTFVTYTHPTQGWTVHYPEGWEVQPRTESATDFRERGTGRYLRVGFTDTPGSDAVAAWRGAAQGFARTHGGYREIRVEKAEYRGYEAAVWEYNWTEGNVLHAINLGFVTGGRGYALNFQTREPDWERSQRLWEAMKERFEPAA
ncbi:MAG TPA: serine/threonine-protein kinase [Frankiaceae bacterium]|nr:serine/threonine-protein kinase [Frankiaceae bacterium]